MILGIIGHAAEKFTDQTEMYARDLIRALIDQWKPTRICSGRSPMGGIDVWAEQIGDELCPERSLIFAPIVRGWNAPGGYKERNQKIAHWSDRIAVIVVRELPPDFKGMPFKSCYHCKGMRPLHVKSGACWTAIRAIKAGKPAEWHYL